MLRSWHIHFFDSVGSVLLSGILLRMTLSGFEQTPNQTMEPRADRPMTFAFVRRAFPPGVTHRGPVRRMGVRREALTLCLWGFASLITLCAYGADVPLSIPIQITHAQNLDPSPSPDGKRLVFISVISGKEQLFTMNIDGSNMAQLTRDDANHEDPAWSPDGTRIVFVLIAGGHNRIAVLAID